MKTGSAEPRQPFSAKSVAVNNMGHRHCDIKDAKAPDWNDVPLREESAHLRNGRQDK